MVPKQPHNNNQDHPKPEILAAYCEDRLPDNEAEELREHLAVCKSCAAMVLELMSFQEELPATLPQASAAQREASWRDLRQALVEDGRLPAPVAPVRRLERREIPAATWRAWALAASLALAVLGIFSFQGYRELARLKTPQVDPPLASLLPQGELRTGDAAEPAAMLVLPAGGRGWLVLNHSASELSSRVRIRFRGRATENVTWETETPVQDPRVFRLEVSRDVLPLGQYQVELANLGPTQETWRTFATYRLDIVAAPSP